MDPISELVELLSQLPSIGERSATRLAFHILGTEPSYADALGDSLKVLHERICRCGRCGNFTATESNPCAICTDPRRDERILCVLARVQDLIAIERSGTFRGRYHVLHGLLAPLDGIGPDDLALDALTSRLDTESIEEIVIATPLSVEGEATALYLSQVLEARPLKLSRIASGVPHGGDLEFTDQVTLGRAFEGRRPL